VIPEKKIATPGLQGEPERFSRHIELFPRVISATECAYRIETFSENAAYGAEKFEAGWTAIVGSELKEFLEARKENMNEKRRETSLKSPRFINVPPARVYDLGRSGTTKRMVWTGKRAYPEYHCGGAFGGKYRWT